MYILSFRRQRLKEKINSGEVLEDEDFAGLALAPLMSENQGGGANDATWPDVS